MGATLKETEVNTEKHFGPAIREFEIVVPANYNHETWLDEFAKKTKGLKTTNYYNDVLTSENFSKVTNRLIPGKTYKVKIFPILSYVSSEGCLAFLSKQNAILVGAHGLMLTHDLQPDQFPVGKWIVSLDEKEALWEYAVGRHGVPYVYRYSDGDWHFDVSLFEGGWDVDYCLLCLCDA